ncbi:MAG: hypothetical protein Q4G68_08430 [Planctomycetia bacterium]|nr:hypothetical protein [Planctomycetia bacterium]
MKLSLICLAMGIFSGFWLDYKGASLSSDAVVYPLLDPMVFGAIILFVLLFGFLLLQKLTPWCQGGTTVALLTIACFLFLVAVISVGVVRNTHWIRLSDVEDVEAVEGESEPANDFGEKNGLPGEEAAP